MTSPSSSAGLLLLPEEPQQTAPVTELSFYSETLTHLYKVADAAFVTPASVNTQTKERGHRTGVSTTVDPEVIAATADSPALRALEQLRGWLNLSYEQLAQIAGLSPSLVYHWRRRHREHRPVRPRASSVERLWRVHATMRSIAEALDGDDSGYGVQMWARTEQDGTSPLALLSQGDVDEFERRAGSLLFDQQPRRPSSWRLVTVDTDEGAEDAPAAPRVDYGDADFG